MRRRSMYCVIFGGTGGVGSALAEKMFKKGYDLHILGRNESKLKHMAERYKARYTIFDILDPEAQPILAKILDRPIDALAYCIGSINLKPFLKLTRDDFILDSLLNSIGAALAIQSSIPYLKQSQEISSVILFSSVAARHGFSAHASISMAKAAVEGLTVSLAAELSPKIRVNCIAPSLLDTPLAASLTSSAVLKQAIADSHPMKRLGRPDDAADLASYLLSSEASWMTGQIIGIDGGRSSLSVRG